MTLIVSNPQQTPGSSVQAFIDLTLLNCKLKGVYQYQATPAAGDKKGQMRTQILVMPTDTEPQGMTLTSLIYEVNQIITSFGGGEEVTEAEMKQTLDSMGLPDFSNIFVQIRQLFIYTDTLKIEEGTSSGTCEYAFNFVITNPVKPDESLKLFHINQLGLAVYKTNRKKIIERMQLEDIAELLA